MTRFYPYPSFSDNCFVVLPVGRTLWREVTHSAIAVWSGHWEPITIHYRLTWDCVFSSSPLTTRRDYSGGILTRLHTGLADWSWKLKLKLIYDWQLVSLYLGVGHPSGTRNQFFFPPEIFFRQLQVCYFVALSLTRGRVCNLLHNCFWALPEQSLLGRSPTELMAIFHFIWDSPNPHEQDGPVIPPGTGFPFCHLLWLAGLQWRYLTCLHMGHSLG
jgi:hypothetical protein